jgi:CoA-dependent NAD(P)H sulfur oxidoreductase
LPYNISDPRRVIDDLVVRQASVFREKMGIRLLTAHRVEAIDRPGRTVSGQGPDGLFKIPYDRLLIATGATPRLPEQPGFDLPGIMVLKTLEHGRAIKTYLAQRQVRRVLILGMGYIAMEMVEALRQRGIAVDMTKPGERFLPWMAGELADTVRRTLEEQQVQIHTGLEIDRIEGGNGRLRGIGAGGQALAADMVLVAIGVQPNSQLAAAAGLELGPSRSIAIDAQMRTSDASILSAGDCADAVHVVTGEKVWIPLALRANRGGWAAADQVCGRTVQLQGVCGTSVFKLFDLEVARTGLNADQALDAGFEPVSVTIKADSRAHAYPGATPIQVHLVGDKGSGRLLGAQMVGREGVAHRINAPAVALHARMTVEQFSQTDLSYAPPFGGTWDPLLVAAIQLLKAL